MILCHSSCNTFSSFSGEANRGDLLLCFREQTTIFKSSDCADRRKTLNFVFTFLKPGIYDPSNCMDRNVVVLNNSFVKIPPKITRSHRIRSRRNVINLKHKLKARYTHFTHSEDCVGTPPLYSSGGKLSNVRNQIYTYISRFRRLLSREFAELRGPLKERLPKRC